MLDRLWSRKKWHQTLGDGDRTSTWSSPTMWRGKGLVKIHMNDVEAHVAWSNDSQNRVQICPVVVEQSPNLVNRFCDLLDVLFEESQGIGIRQHDPSDVAIKCRLERFKINQAPFVGWQGRHFKSPEGHRRRISPMS